MEGIQEIADRLSKRARIRTSRERLRHGSITPDDHVNTSRICHLTRAIRKLKTQCGLHHEPGQEHEFMSFRHFKPKPFQRPAFEYAIRFAQRPKTNLVLYGQSGVGKTHLACSIMYQQIYNRIDRRTWIIGSPPNYMFVDCMEFRDRLYALFGSKTGFAETERILQKMIDAPVLVLDDFAAEANTSNSLRDRIARVVKSRLDRGFVTITTTNVSAGEIRERYHKRVYDRLVKPAKIIKIEGPSQRGKT